MATKAAKVKQSVYDELSKAAATAPKKNEGYAAYITRLCEALNQLEDEEWAALSTGARTWVDTAFKAVKANKAGTVGVPEGCPLEPDEQEDDDEVVQPKAKGKAKAKAAVEPDDEDEDDEPVAVQPKAKGKAKAKAAVEPDDDEDEEADQVEVVPAPKSKGKEKAKVAEPSDEEDEEDDDIAVAPKGKRPQPVSSKGKAKIAEPVDDEDGAEAEAEAAEVVAAPKGKKAKKAAPAAVATPSDSRKFLEMVVLNYGLPFDKLAKRARKQGIECADSQLQRMYRQTAMVVNVQTKHDLLSTGDDARSSGAGEGAASV